MASSSSGFTGFTDATKREVVRVYGQRCWHCHFSPAEHAHVLPKVFDQERFSNLQNRGRLNLRSLREFGNATLLCGTCHANFDLSQPNLVIYPSDIDWFLRWEETDFERRKHDSELHKELRIRRPPTVADYRESEAKALLYTRLSLGDWHPGLTIAKEASWEGDPMAAFQSSFRAIADERMPLAVKEKLYSYSRLLDEHDLESINWTNSTQTIGRHSRDQREDDSEDDEEEHDRTIDGSTRSIRTYGKPALTGSRDRRGDGSLYSLGSRSHSREAAYSPQNIDHLFVYGPRFTTDRCVEYVLNLRQQSRAV